MAFAFLPFPILQTYTLTSQFFILIGLFAISYFYRRARLVLAGLLSAYTVFKVAPPLVRWGYAAFKAIAMFGFYINFFIIGVGYIATAAGAVWNFPELLKSFAEGLEGK